MQYKNVTVAVRQFRDGLLQSDPINNGHLVRICSAMNGLLGHLTVVGDLFILYAAPAEVHQHLIDRQSVKPGRECGVAAETSCFSEQLYENFLREIFSFRS